MEPVTTQPQIEQQTAVQPAALEPKPKRRLRAKAEAVRKLLPIFTALLVGITCLAVLYAGSNIGLSDNGDFRRVLLANQMDYADDTNSGYLFKQEYVMDISGDTAWERIGSLLATSQDEVEYTSPHFAFIKVSKLLNYAVNRITGQPPTCYFLFYLALLYSLVLSAAAFLIVRFFQALASRITAALLFLLVFCDAGYLLYFNSFYGEALQFVTLMLLIGLILTLFRSPRNYVALVFFYITLYLFAGSKLANIPFAMLIALFSLLLLLLGKGWRFRTILSGSVCVTVAALMVLYTSIPAWMDYDTTYQSVFFGILKSSSTPEQDLEELGLDTSLSVLQNTHAYMSSYPVDIHSEDFAQQFYEKTGKVDIALFYLQHPVRLTQKLALAVQNSASIRPPYLGTQTDVRMAQTNRWSLWSHLRMLLHLPYQPWFVLPFLLLLTLANITVLLIQFFHRRTCSRKAMVTSGFFLLLLAGIWANLAIPIIGNGEADLSKHMFLFIHLMDVLFAALFAAFLLHIRQIGAFFAKSAKRILCCVLPILLATMFTIYSNHAAYPDTFLMGSWEGQPIEWEILRQNPDGSVKAVSRRVLATHTYDQSNVYGSNLWSQSDVRNWLNSAFLDCFTSAERARLLPMDVHVLLAEPYAAQSEGGNHPHYWTADPNTVAALYEDAYFQTVRDSVSLLTLSDYQNASFHRTAGQDYWLLDPYTANADMVRYAGRHGFVIHRDANTPLGIRPVITVKSK